MNEDRHLNTDAIYAAMVHLRDYAESPEGREAFDALLEEKSAKVDALRDMGEAIGAATVNIRPVFDLLDETKEEIYPSEPESVDAGIEMARSVIWGPPDYVSVMLKDADLEDPMIAALSRFVADRAN